MCCLMWRCRPREGKKQVIVGQSISMTDVKLETCAECHLGEQAGATTFMKHQNKPLTVQKICVVHIASR